MSYINFVEKKTRVDYDQGFDPSGLDIHESLYPFQKASVEWAIKKGRAGMFLDTGLGKTRVQIEWLVGIMKKASIEHGLIVCPLSIADQTIKEAVKIDQSIKYVTSKDNIESPGIYITNYERLDSFDGLDFGAVVLDESSILKSVGGKTKKRIIEMFKNTQYKLSCTATPAPNDVSELGNQVDFLGIMTREEMLSKFFVHDGPIWRLKGHAKHDFYKFMASWSICIRKPSDIGFSDEGYNLPGLNIEALFTKGGYVPDGELFAVDKLSGIIDRARERKETVNDKVDVLADYVKNNDDQWIIWCGINAEADAIVKAIPGSMQVKGADKIEKKIETFEDFKTGKLRVLVTKPKIASMGLNFQNAHRMAFLGLDDSYEKYYQAIRREYRYGQKKAVDVKIVLTNAEQGILANVMRKEKEADNLFTEVVKEMQSFTKEEMGISTKKMEDVMDIKIVENETYRAMRGDSIETIKTIDDNSVDMELFSPPFFSLYVYSPSPRDIGNNGNDQDFWKHMSFLIPDLFRVLKPGRVCAVHAMNVPATLVRDGYIGLKDFRGDIIREFEKHGFIYDNEAIIPKNPQAQSIRTRSKGLTFTQFEKDSSWSRPALPDYLIKFRKPGDNMAPVRNGENGELSRDRWIELASGIWPSVRETYTLNTIKHNGDEKHMVPLQLDTIENAIKLWSNPGDTVYTPFGGIGSEGYGAILAGRKAILGELKPEYFDQLLKNLDRAIEKTKESCLDFGAK